MPRPAFLRDINQARVLRLLKEKGVLSRAEIARFLGLTRSTVTLVTGELIEKGLIAATGEAFVTQLTGRPGAALKLNGAGAYFLGVEIGADEVHLLLIDLFGSIIHHETVPHRSTKPEAVCQDLTNLVLRVWSERLKNSDRLRGVGFAVSGLINAQGVIRKAPTLGWHDVDLKNELLVKLPLPAFAENDANAAALAELSFGGRVGYSDLCVLLLDSGVGAGIISERKLFRGYMGLAGEIGHLCLEPAKRHPDEEIGFLESRVGRNNLLASYRRAGGKAKDLAGLLEDLARNGLTARKAVEIWAEWLALTISNLADIANPKLVVLAGPLSELYPFVEKRVRKRLEERKFPTVEELEIEVSTFGRDSAALGGAALVFNGLFSVPDSSFLGDLA
ncbi:MAG: ROK family transcriptional regulator [Verrucomicrobia bacterium]|nr:ROK family transcriptional regulator [Verrucomicrobiota bacterium]